MLKVKEKIVLSTWKKYLLKQSFTWMNYNINPEGHILKISEPNCIVLNGMCLY